MAIPLISNLHAKLSVTLLIIFSVIGVFLTGIIIWSSELYFEEVTQELNASIPMYVLESADAIPKLIENGKINKTAFRVLSNRVMVINPSVELYILKPDGTILDASTPNELLKKSKININPINQYLSGKHNFPLKGDDPLHPNEQKIFSAAKIINNGVNQGFLYTIFGGSKYDNLIYKLRWKYLTQVAGVAILATLLFGFATGVITFGFLTRRLEKLAEQIQKFKNNKFTILPVTEKYHNHKQVRAQDEIDKLQSNFLEMAKTIMIQLEDDKKLDELRREFITNISHDLRTPITLIHSYIETLIIKKNSLKNIEQSEFLNIVIKHSQYLNQLVDQLYELSKLNSNTVQLELSSFSISDLIQNTIKNFTIITEQKKLNLKFHSNLDFDNNITADKRLIERVFTNLIDNAINYTPDNGTIIIKLEQFSKNTIQVSVKDNGLGISKDQLSYIFDRYFQIKKLNQYSTKSGLGLGLAIVKKIIELHGCSITVDSIENVGTEFIFDLSKDTQTHKKNHQEDSFTIDNTKLLEIE